MHRVLRLIHIRGARCKILSHWYIGVERCKMYHLLTVLHLLTLSTTIFGKSVPIYDDDEYSRYALNYGMGDLYTRQYKVLPDEKYGERMTGGMPLDPEENLRILEYPVDDYGGFNALVQRLASSLTPLPLFGPLPMPLPPVNPLIDPLNYGFGAAPVSKAPVKISGNSYPWDPKTRSYGGWVPLRGPRDKRPLATLVSRQYIDGHLYKVRSKPIMLTGKTIVIRRTVVSD